MQGIQQPLGLFLDNDGKPLASGRLYFLDKGTSNEKTAYYDEALTTPAPNPYSLNGSGSTGFQLFLGTGQYTIQLFSLNPGVLSPIFPTDYTLVRQWDQDGTASGTALASSVSYYSTMALLRAVAPTGGEQAWLSGYYTALDAPPVFYRYNASESSADNGCTIIRPNGYGTGAWVLQPVSRIDVRNAGCQYSGGTVNANISNAIACAVDRGVPVYFPAVTYLVQGTTTQNVDADLNVDEGAFFSCDIGTYKLKPRRAWSIGKGTHGTARKFILDLLASYTLLPEGCDLTWWNADNDIDSFEIACQYSGISGLRIDAVQTMGEPTNPVTAEVSRLVYGATSSIAFSNVVNSVTLTIGDIVIENERPNEYALFIATTGTLASRLVFNIPMKTSWVSGGTTGTQAVFGMASSVVVDNFITITGVSAPYGNVIPAGGTITAVSCAVGVNVIGKQNDFLICGTSGTFVGCYDPDMYLMGNSTQVSGFITSCANAGVPATFRGKPLTIGTLSIGTACTISDLFLVGNISATALLLLYNCKIIGDVSSNTLVDFISSRITGSFTTDRLKARASSFGTTCSANETEAQASEFNGALSLGYRSNTVYHDLKSCRIATGIILTAPAGANISHLCINECNFKNCTTPINYSGLLSTTYTYINIANNVPRCFDSASVPSNCVPQTHLDLQIQTNSASYTLALNSVAWAFVPSGLTMPARNMNTSSWWSGLANVDYSGTTSAGTLALHTPVSTVGAPHVIADLY